MALWTPEDHFLNFLSKWMFFYEISLLHMLFISFFSCLYFTDRKTYIEVLSLCNTNISSYISNFIMEYIYSNRTWQKFISYKEIIKIIDFDRPGTHEERDIYSLCLTKHACPGQGHRGFIAYFLSKQATACEKSGVSQFDADFCGGLWRSCSWKASGKKRFTAH